MKVKYIWLCAISLAGVVENTASESRADEQPIGILLSAGDIATCDKDPVRNGDATAKLVEEEIKRVNDKFPGVEIRALALGDVFYPVRSKDGSLKSSAEECAPGATGFHASWGRFKDKILPVPGNHDLEVASGAAYFDYFEPTLTSLDSRRGTYALDFPSKGDKRWRLIGLNPYRRTWADPVTKKTVKLSDWLKAELEQAKATGKCVLAFAHPFFYSSGFHGHNDRNLDQPLVPLDFMRDIFTELYYGRASVFLAGHDHHFEQLGRAGPNADPKDLGKGAIEEDDGVRSFVVGTGGKALYSRDYEKKWDFTEAYDVKSFGILKIELYPSSYKWEFIPQGSNSSSMHVIKKVNGEPVNKDKCNLPKKVQIDFARRTGTACDEDVRLLRNQFRHDRQSKLR